MDASRLLAVISDVEAEHNGGLAQALKTLIAQYTSARDAPTQDNSASIGKALDAINEIVDSSDSADYTPSNYSILRSIGGAQWVGAGFRERLSDVLSIAGQTTAGIVTGLTQLQSEMDAYKKSCVQARTGLEALGISAYAVGCGAFEAGVLIPESLVGGQLGGLVKELESWNKIVRVFQEVAGEDEREVSVSQLASGSYEIYLSVGLLAAGYLSRTIDKILEWYLTILDIRTKRLELQKLGAPVAEAKLVETYERDFLESEIRKLARQLVVEAEAKHAKDRKHELEQLLLSQIRQMVRFVDRGGTCQVDSTPPASPNEPDVDRIGDVAPEERDAHERNEAELKVLAAAHEKVMAILASGRALKQLPQRPEQILQISDSAPEIAARPPATTPKTAAPRKSTRSKR